MLILNHFNQMRTFQPGSQFSSKEQFSLPREHCSVVVVVMVCMASMQQVEGRDAPKLYNAWDIVSHLQQRIHLLKISRLRNAAAI